MAVVNNASTNYALFYNIVDFFGTIMNNHPSIAKVTYGDMYEIDTTEFPAYPLGNLIITNARFEDKTIVLNVTLTIADKIKDKNNESVGEKNAQRIPFYGTDDTMDIHANTLSILNDLLAYTDYGVNAFNFRSAPNAMAFKDTLDNGLAGWTCSFDLEAFNANDRCLFNLDGTGQNGVDLC